MKLRESSEIVNESRIVSIIIHVTVTVGKRSAQENCFYLGLLSLSILALLVIPDLLLQILDRSTETVYIYGAQELNSIVVVLICIARMPQLRRALFKPVLRCSNVVISSSESQSNSLLRRWITRIK